MKSTAYAAQINAAVTTRKHCRYTVRDIPTQIK